VPVNEVQQWESQFLQFVCSSKADLLAQITSEGALTDEVTAAVEAALTEFQGQYSGGS
jgi:F0F1-type ATP synthase alpha subunit